MCAQAGETGSLRTTATRARPLHSNCTGLHKALEDGMPERRDERQPRDSRRKTDETTTKRKAFAI